VITVTPQWQRWAAAAIVLAADPYAQVRCPHHDDGFLEVTDVPLPGAAGRVERHLRCPGCGAGTSLRNPGSGEAGRDRRA
jgi:hypothetical protein